jgi:iron complex outermembrane recepter protein
MLEGHIANLLPIDEGTRAMDRGSTRCLLCRMLAGTATAIFAANVPVAAQGISDSGYQGITPRSPVTQDAPIDPLLLTDMDVAATPEGSASSETLPENDLSRLMDMVSSDPSVLADVEIQSRVAPTLQQDVSSVTKTSATLAETSAAVYVLTAEQIRRSGATTIPDVLRLIPGVYVGQITGGRFQIGTRGFSERQTSRMLVQIDGRLVYDPLYGGVFWDIQQLPIADIERIEVIRGPGGAIWDVNASTGVIDIRTRSANHKDGTRILGAGGNERIIGEGSHSGRIAGDGSYRVWGQWQSVEEQLRLDGPASDDWNAGSTGVRADWQIDKQTSATVIQGFANSANNANNIFVAPPPQFSQERSVNEYGSNWYSVATLDRRFSDTDGWTLQAFYDGGSRGIQDDSLNYTRHVMDLDWSHRFQLGERHQMSWGLGYRITFDRIIPKPDFLTLEPNEDIFDQPSLFVQDRIALRQDHLWFTLGTKVSRNDFTGIEVQPTAGLTWMPTKRVSLWSSFSRAVRTAGRGFFNGILVQPPVPSPLGPVYPVLTGNEELAAENLDAIEAGIRHQPTESLSWDLAAYQYFFDDVIRYPTQPPQITPLGILIPNVPINRGTTTASGAELSATWRVNDAWRLVPGYSYSMVNDARDGEVSYVDDPRHMFFAHSLLDLPGGWQLDGVGRVMGDRLQSQTDGYVTCDLRVSWRPRPGLDLFVIGRNLADRSHVEKKEALTSGGLLGTEVEREFIAGTSLTW